MVLGELATSVFAFAGLPVIAMIAIVFGLAAMALGGLCGFLGGTLASRRLPAELSKYSPARGTLSLRFRHPEYAAGVLAAMRARTQRAL